MSDLMKHFERFLGRAATDTERKNLLFLQKKTGINDEDPIWAVFYGLQYFDTLYGRMPKQIKAAVREAMDDAAAMLAVEVSAATVRAAAALKRAADSAEASARAVAESADAIAGVRNAAWQGAVGAAVVLTVLSAVMAWIFSSPACHATADPFPPALSDR